MHVNTGSNVNHLAQRTQSRRGLGTGGHEQEHETRHECQRETKQGIDARIVRRNHFAGSGICSGTRPMSCIVGQPPTRPGSLGVTGPRGKSMAVLLRRPLARVRACKPPDLARLRFVRGVRASRLPSTSWGPLARVRRLPDADRCASGPRRSRSRRASLMKIVALVAGPRLAVLVVPPRSRRASQWRDEPASDPPRYCLRRDSLIGTWWSEGKEGLMKIVKTKSGLFEVLLQDGKDADKKDVTTPTRSSATGSSRASSSCGTCARRQRVRPTATATTRATATPTA